LSLVSDGPGHSWTTEGFALTCFLHTWGFNFRAGFRKGAGGGGGQGESLVHGYIILGCGVEGNHSLVILGTGAGVKVIVHLVIAIELGGGTKAIFGGWAEKRLLTTLVTWVISATSSSDIAAKLLRVWDCCCMSSSRHWKFLRMVSIASSVANVTLM